MKGTNPLGMTVFLIILTMILAAFLAALTSKVPAPERPNCDASIRFISGFPKYDSGSIKAVVEVSGAPLGGFVFEVVLQNATVLHLRDVLNSSVAPGTLGTVVSEPVPVSRAEVSQVRIVTNCTGVKTLMTALK